MKMFLPSILGLGLAACAYQVPRTGIGSFMAANYALEINDTEAAAQFLEKALEREPENPLIISQAFEFQMTEGNFQAALQLANKLESINKATAPMLGLLALQAFKKGNWSRANDYMDRVNGLGLDSLVAPLILGWSHVSQGDLDAGLEAIASMEQVPAFDEFRQVHRVYMLDFSGRTQDAIEAYQEIYSISQVRSLQPIIAHASLLARSGRQGDAVSLIRSYLEKVPQSYALKDALRQLEKGGQLASIALRPVQAMAYSLLNAATQLSRDNVHGPAILYARLSQFLDPEIEESYLLLGNLFLQTGRTASARKALRKIDSDSPLFEFATVRLAHAYRREGKDKRSIRTLRTFLEDDPQNVLVRSTLADFLRELENFEEARIEYTRAIQSSEDQGNADWFLYFARGVTREQSGAWEAAEADLRKSLELNPGEPLVLNYLGYSLIDRGYNFEEARGYIEDAVSKSPNDGAIVDSMGWVQYLLGDYQEAVESLERAVELEPADPVINEHLGDAYWMVGRRLEARFQWRHALDLEPVPDRIPEIERKIALGLQQIERAGKN